MSTAAAATIVPLSTSSSTFSDIPNNNTNSAFKTPTTSTTTKAAIKVPSSPAQPSSFIVSPKSGLPPPPSRHSNNQMSPGTHTYPSSTVWKPTSPSAGPGPGPSTSCGRYLDNGLPSTSANNDSQYNSIVSQQHQQQQATKTMAVASLISASGALKSQKITTTSTTTTVTKATAARMTTTVPSTGINGGTGLLRHRKLGVVSRGDHLGFYLKTTSLRALMDHSNSFASTPSDESFALDTPIRDALRTMNKKGLNAVQLHCSEDAYSPDSDEIASRTVFCGVLNILDIVRFCINNSFTFSDSANSNPPNVSSITSKFENLLSLPISTLLSETPHLSSINRVKSESSFALDLDDLFPTSHAPLTASVPFPVPPVAGTPLSTTSDSHGGESGNININVNIRDPSKGARTRILDRFSSLMDAVRVMRAGAHWVAIKDTLADPALSCGCGVGNIGVVGGSTAVTTGGGSTGGSNNPFQQPAFGYVVAARRSSVYPLGRRVSFGSRTVSFSSSSNGNGVGSGIENGGEKKESGVVGVGGSGDLRDDGEGVASPWLSWKMDSDGEGDDIDQDIADGNKKATAGSNLAAPRSESPADDGDDITLISKQAQPKTVLAVSSHGAMSLPKRSSSPTSSSKSSPSSSAKSSPSPSRSPRVGSPSLLRRSLHQSESASLASLIGSARNSVPSVTDFEKMLETDAVLPTSTYGGVGVGFETRGASITRGTQDANVGHKGDAKSFAKFVGGGRAGFNAGAHSCNVSRGIDGTRLIDQIMLMAFLLEDARRFFPELLSSPVHEIMRGRSKISASPSSLSFPRTVSPAVNTATAGGTGSGGLVSGARTVSSEQLQALHRPVSMGNLSSLNAGTSLDHVPRSPSQLHFTRLLNQHLAFAKAAMANAAVVASKSEVDSMQTELSPSVQEGKKLVFTLGGGQSDDSPTLMSTSTVPVSTTSTGMVPPSAPPVMAECGLPIVQPKPISAASVVVTSSTPEGISSSTTPVPTPIAAPIAVHQLPSSAASFLSPFLKASRCATPPTSSLGLAYERSSSRMSGRSVGSGVSNVSGTRGVDGLAVVGSMCTVAESTNAIDAFRCMLDARCLAVGVVDNENGKLISHLGVGDFAAGLVDFGDGGGDCEISDAFGLPVLEYRRRLWEVAVREGWSAIDGSGGIMMMAEPVCLNVSGNLGAGSNTTGSPFKVATVTSLIGSGNDPTSGVKNVVTVSEALDKMVAARQMQAWLVDEVGKPVGVLTLSDVIGYLGSCDDRTW
ncbi:hypothetical protein HDU76_009329 [Blyttiomyces sp. JEL0837]|nr:hypothetical protein HDU76_009329 [Blyttiomyces sp. JEL0837]